MEMEYKEVNNKKRPNKYLMKGKGWHLPYNHIKKYIQGLTKLKAVEL